VEHFFPVLQSGVEQVQSDAAAAHQPANMPVGNRTADAFEERLPVGLSSCNPG